MLHPPSETKPSLPEYDGVASGCVLLPGLPHLGLDHRAGWAEADHTGAVCSMRGLAGIDPMDDADTAVLAMLLRCSTRPTQFSISMPAKNTP